VPTYFFVAGVAVLCGLGAWHWATGTIVPVTTPDALVPLGRPLTLLLLLTAFSNGCTAMTGVEAVSNGVPAFRPPEAKNAVATMGTMAVLAIGMFLSITLLAQAYHVVPSPTETVLSQLGRGISGGRSLLYFAVQAGTTLILVLAANTAYADFPRLASILARDRFLPRQFMNQGDRLAFSNGILGLSAFAAVLLIAFRGDTNALIPLYMIGVFVSFTLSQSGMVVHWWRLRTPRWRLSATVNGVGAVVTGLVLVVVAVTKALEGAWIILILIPINVWLFRATKRHYDRVSAQLTLADWTPDVDRTANLVVVPISGVHRAVVQALDYAKTLSPDVRAVYVSLNPATTEEIRKSWATWGRGVPLVVLESPYRSLMEPLLEYLGNLRLSQRAFITVVLPEFVPARWWHAVFHNQSALLIKGALLFTPNTVVTSVPFHLAR